VLSVVGGALNLPTKGWLLMDEWLEPVIGAHHAAAVTTGEKWALAMTVLVTSVVGVLLARALWLRRTDRSGLEPKVLRNAWGVDSLFSFLFGSGGRLVAAGSAAFDKQVVDGGVNGLGNLVRIGGGYLRRVQTGYVRNYALGIAAGSVLLLGWALFRVAG
jgi:NADH-quinone oxidoreductase subunit L